MLVPTRLGPAGTTKVDPETLPYGASLRKVSTWPVANVPGLPVRKTFCEASRLTPAVMAGLAAVLVTLTSAAVTACTARGAASVRVTARIAATAAGKVYLRNRFISELLFFHVYS